MFVLDAQNNHYQYMDVHRHWCPQSEAFTGGDALVTFLHEGWKVVGDVSYQEHWRAGRCITVCYFPLRRSAETLLMPVLANPYVYHITRQLNLRIVPTAEQARQMMYQERELRRA